MAYVSTFLRVLARYHGTPTTIPTCSLVFSICLFTFFTSSVFSLLIPSEVLMQCPEICPFIAVIGLFYQ